jgi:hypothetical protein
LHVSAHIASVPVFSPAFLDFFSCFVDNAACALQERVEERRRDGAIETEPADLWFVVLFSRRSIERTVVYR